MNWGVGCICWLILGIAVSGCSPSRGAANDNLEKRSRSPLYSGPAAAQWKIKVLELKLPLIPELRFTCYMTTSKEDVICLIN